MVLPVDHQVVDQGHERSHPQDHAHHEASQHAVDGVVKTHLIAVFIEGAGGAFLPGLVEEPVNLIHHVRELVCHRIEAGSPRSQRHHDDQAVEHVDDGPRDLVGNEGNGVAKQSAHIGPVKSAKVN